MIVKRWRIAYSGSMHVGQNPFFRRTPSANHAPPGWSESVDRLAHMMKKRHSDHNRAPPIGHTRHEANTRSP